VLCLNLVTQCAMLEEFRIFLVLAKGVGLTLPPSHSIPVDQESPQSLYAYDMEALVSSATHSPKKLSGSDDVLFFSVGKLGERSLAIYMKKSGVRRVILPPNEWGADGFADGERVPGA
jgi:hypothetical protein